MVRNGSPPETSAASIAARSGWVQTVQILGISFARPPLANQLASLWSALPLSQRLLGAGIRFEFGTDTSRRDVHLPTPFYAHPILVMEDVLLGVRHSPGTNLAKLRIQPTNIPTASLPPPEDNKAARKSRAHRVSKQTPKDGKPLHAPGVSNHATDRIK